MPQPIFSFDDITVKSQNQTLFEGLNFRVNKGENWALLGASGSGKTAFLETVAGNLHISKGTVEHPFFDEYVLEYSPSDPLFNWHRLIAKVSPRHQFRNRSNTSDFYYQQRFNSMDSEDSETVASYLQSIPSNRKDGRWTYDRVVPRLKLEPLLDKELIKLSNGETKRLLLASALLTNPSILLMDNPLTGLDTASRADFNSLVAEISDSGISVIMATSPMEIPDAITHIAVLENRKVSRVFTKSEFAADQLSIPSHRTLDIGLLRELMAAPGSQQYNVIVGMNEVTIKYDEKVILNKVDWTVKPGERWALLGHNGAGKSTLLSLINGDNPQAYANKITLFDRQRGSGESIWEIKSKIGFLSPELFQYFPMETSCLQAVESGFYDTIGLFRPSVASHAETCRKWMNLLGIESSATKLLKHVSVSTQRLCLIARALVKNPALLIFDEPCQGLDSSQQAYFKHVIDSICENSDVTMIYVSHYQEEIPASVNHTLKLEQGMVTENK